MKLLRVRKEKTDNYTVISNAFLRDKNLSLNAKGFLTFIMSLPEDWDFSVEGSATVLREGRRSILTIIKELEKNGYCSKKQFRGENNVFGKIQYTFYEYCVDNQPQCVLPQAGEPHAAKSTQRNKDVKEIKKEINKNVDVDNINNINNNSKNAPQPQLFDIQDLEKTIHF